MPSSYPNPSVTNPGGSAISPAARIPHVLVQAGAPMLLIDPGHGGSDPGATAHGLVEKVLTLRTAQFLGAMAMASGLPVALTRSDDMGLTLSVRGQRARNEHATQVVCIHFDVSLDPEVGRLMTYARPGDDTSRALAQILGRVAPAELAPSPSPILVEAVGWKKRAHNVVTAFGGTPALLVECAFLTKTAHATYVAREEGLRALAASLLAAITAAAANHRPLPADTAEGRVPHL
jgi:N-acetylmuramoyl-L-alanine amidase